MYPFSVKEIRMLRSNLIFFVGSLMVHFFVLLAVVLLLMQREATHTSEARILLREGLSSVKLTLAPVPLPQDSHPKTVEKIIPEDKPLRPMDTHKILKEEVKEKVTNNSQKAAADNQKKGINSKIKSIGLTKPDYPRMSHERGEEGQVRIQVQVLASGQLGELDVMTSSGFTRLDNAALQAVKEARFSPALKNGKAVDSKRIFTFLFRIPN